MKISKEMKEKAEKEIHEATDKIVDLLNDLDISKYSAIHSLGAALFCVLDSLGDKAAAKEMLRVVMTGIEFSVSEEPDQQQETPH